MCLLAQILKAWVLDPRQHWTLDTDKNRLYITRFSICYWNIYLSSSLSHRCFTSLVKTIDINAHAYGYQWHKQTLSFMLICFCISIYFYYSFIIECRLSFMFIWIIIYETFYFCFILFLVSTHSFIEYDSNKFYFNFFRY